jgi:hypothetical protein
VPAWGGTERNLSTRVNWAGRPRYGFSRIRGVKADEKTNAAVEHYIAMDERDDCLTEKPAAVEQIRVRTQLLSLEVGANRTSKQFPCQLIRHSEVGTSAFNELYSESR